MVVAPLLLLLLLLLLLPLLLLALVLDIRHCRSSLYIHYILYLKSYVDHKLPVYIDLYMFINLCYVWHVLYYR